MRERREGIEILNNLSWGTHICHLYQNKEDLLEILVPYFRAGLKNNEFCFWITCSLTQKEAEKAMRKAIPDFDEHLKKGQIEIIPYDEWYLKDNKFNPEKVLNAWINKYNQAIGNGYEGMRVTGDVSWLEREYWDKFADYEWKVNFEIDKYKFIAICSYRLNCSPFEIVDVVSKHNYTLAKWDGRWVAIPNSEFKKAENKLGASEFKFKQFFENEPEYCYMVSTDGVILDINKAALKALGYRKDELVGKPLETIYAPESLSKMRKLFEKWRKTGELKNEEMVIISKSGDKRIVLLSASAVRDCEGNILYSISVQKDITDRKEMEKTLKENEQKYRNVIENAVEGIVITQDGLIRFVNPAIKRITGYSKEDVLDKLFIDFIHPDDKEKVIENYAKRLRGEKLPELYSFRIIDKNGNTKWLQINAIPITWEGKPATLSFLNDVTEEKRAQEELKESEERFRAISESAQDAIVILDEEGKISYWNKSAERISGYRSEEILGKHWLSLVPKKYHEDYDKKFKRYKEAGKEFTTEKTIELYALKKDGSEFPIELSLSSVRICGKWNAIAIVRDITERKEAEKKLRESERKYRTTFEHTGTAMTLVEEDTTLSLVNEEFAKLSGYSKEEIEGKMSWTQFVHPDDLQRMKEYHYARRRGGNAPKKYEFRFIDRNGNIKNIFITIDVIPETGQSVASLIDITWLKRLNSLLNAVSEINELVARERNPELVLKTACDKLADVYDAVFVFLKEDGSLIPVESRGVSLRLIKRETKNCPFIQRALQGEIVKSSMNDKCSTCIINHHKHGLSLPLIGESTHGAIMIHSNSELRDEEMKLLEKLSRNIAFALDAYELSKSRREAFEQLAANLTVFDKSADRLRNPLAVIISSLELIDELGKDKVLEIIGEQAKRMKKELDELREEEVKTFRLVEEGNTDNNRKISRLYENQ